MVQSSQDINELRDQREKLRKEIETLRAEGDSPVQQVGYKSAASISDTNIDEVARLRELLAEIEERIQGLESENDPPDEDLPSHDSSDDDPAAIQLEELTQRNGTQLAIARTERPFLLPVNVLVIPVDEQGGVPVIQLPVRRELGEDVWKALRDEIQTAVSSITPEKPILVSLSSSLGPQVLTNAPEMPDESENGRYQIIVATTAHSNSGELDSAATVAAIINLACTSQVTQLAVPLLGSGQTGLDGGRIAQNMLKAIYDAIPDTENPLNQVILTTRPTADDDKNGVVAAARDIIAMLTANRAQKLSADSASGEDTLGIEKEVSALAETLLLRDVETPLAVGVLGGWGSGKSFVMYLMLKEMMRIRSLKVNKEWKDWDAVYEAPYVGHVYPIEFNAWTYAKSDLWASLMETIFMELNKQLTMEQLIGKDLLLDGSYWLELSQYGEKEREALQSEVGQAAIKEAMEKWQQGQAPDSLWQAYDEVRSTETTAMKATMAERDVKQAILEDLDTQLEMEKIETIPQKAREQVWEEIITTAVFSEVAEEIQDELKKSTFSEKDLEDLGKLSVKLKQFRPTITEMWQEQTFTKWFQEQQGLLITAGLLLLAAILAPLISAAYEWLAQSATMTSITTFLAGVGSVAMAMFRTYQPWLDKIQRWNDGISSVVNMADEMLTTKKEQIISQKEIEVEIKRKELEAEIATLNQEIAQHRQRLGIAGEFTSLHDFVTSRLETGDYRERLGMLHQTQTDLQELTNTLMIHGNTDLFAEQKKGFFPRGPARVILFVDDLDRCPPHKVVEVLEAVQLLLRTKLFVVVLGLDTRYVTRALEKEYVGILTRMGDPSGLDYIEKIIQIPYRVRPIEPEKLHGFLEAQMEMVAETPPDHQQNGKEEETDGKTAVTPHPDSQGQQPATNDTPVGNSPTQTTSAESTSADSSSQSAETTIENIPPKIVKFHKEDFNDLKNACVALGLTPRSIKRLINVLKLIKVFWFRTNQNKKQREIRTVIILLTLSARYPEIMAQVFHNIEMAFREQAKHTAKLEEFLVQDLAMGKLIPETQQTTFKTAVTNLKLEDITLAELGLETFHLVRSFSFVGDPTLTSELEK